MDLPFAEYLKKNPKVVIGILLGLIVIAGAAGTIYIEHLHSSLVEQKNVYESMLKANDDRLRNATEQYARRISDAGRVVNQLEQEARVVSDGAAKLPAQLREFAAISSEIKQKTRLGPQITKRLDAAVVAASESSVAISSAATTAQTLSRVFASPPAAPAAASSVADYDETPEWAMLIVSLFLGAAIGWWGGRRWVLARIKR